MQLSKQDMTGKPMSIMEKTAETVGEGFQLASAKLDRCGEEAG